MKLWPCINGWLKLTLLTILLAFRSLRCLIRLISNWLFLIMSKGLSTLNFSRKRLRAKDYILKLFLLRF